MSISGEEEVEKLLSQEDKMFVLRINVQFKPENDETFEKYEAWHSMEPSCGSCYKTSGIDIFTNENNPKVNLFSLLFEE